MQEVDIFKAFANERRLQILEWLKDPRAHFPRQADGDLVEDGVCAGFDEGTLIVSGGPPAPKETSRPQTGHRAARGGVSAPHPIQNTRRLRSRHARIGLHHTGRRYSSSPIPN